MSCGWAKLLCCLLLLTCKNRERAGAGGWLLAMLLFACACICVSCVAHSADGERRRGWAADVLDMVSSSAWRLAPKRLSLGLNALASSSSFASSDAARWRGRQRGGVKAASARRGGDEDDVDAGGADVWAGMSRAPREGGEVAAERAVRQGGPAGFWPKPR